METRASPSPPIIYAPCACDVLPASLFAIALLVSITGHAANIASLGDLSLEQLGNIEVTSVSKNSESLRSAAAAVTVVTGEDIRRSGATTIPDALRFVPGLNVAQQISNAWSVSARGFSSINSEKLLVLSDTRSIYTPLFSGVLWDVQDYLMADIDRIEVIRGPGAALWGSNAVNGVINITTKSAQATQGLHVETAIGDEERVNAGVRYGGTTDSGISYRVFGKYFDRDDSVHAFSSSDDDWRMGHVGIRSDWDATDVDSITVQGDLYRGTIGRIAPSITIIGRAGPTGALDVDVSGGNIVARWRHQIDAKSNFILRAYYDNTHRDDPSYRDDLDTYDLDFQHQFPLAARQTILWGLNYREMENRNVGKGIFNVSPASSRDRLLSAFLQDQIDLSETLQLTLGSKFEHNDFSGDEWQPSVRAAWDFAVTQTVWAAWSHAVRVPTRLERDISVDVLNPPANPMFRLDGNRNFDAEEMDAYEIGYRWQALDNVSVDLATFYNDYDKLASLEIGLPYTDPNGVTIIPVLNENMMRGHSSGAELQVVYSPLGNWRLAANYSYLDMQLEPQGLDINRGRFLAGSTPRHQVGLRSTMDLPGAVQFDVQLRYLSAIRHLPDIVDGGGLSDYGEADVRLAKRLSPQLEVSLVGRNLLHDHHAEFGAAEARGEIQRSFYAKAVWTY